MILTMKQFDYAQADALAQYHDGLINKYECAALIELAVKRYNRGIKR